MTLAMKEIDSPVRVDFHNADVGGFVRLNTAGAISDLKHLGVVLHDGLKLQ